MFITSFSIYRLLSGILNFFNKTIESILYLQLLKIEVRTGMVYLKACLMIINLYRMTVLIGQTESEICSSELSIWGAPHYIRLAKKRTGTVELCEIPCVLAMK